MSQSRTLGLSLLGLLVFAACPKPSPTLQMIVISPENPRIAQGGSERLVATGVYSDASTRVMTDDVAWTVDDSLIARASDSEAGAITGVSPGSTTVRAHFDGVAGARQLTVTEANVRSLEVSPAQPVVPLGLPVDLQVFAVHTDLTVENVTEVALFNVADPTICTLSAARLTAKLPGKTTVSVSYQGVNAQFEVTVTAATVKALSIDPPTATMPAGVSQRFTATAVLTDQSTLDVTTGVEWASSAPSIAFATNAGTNKGVVLGRVKGRATLTATLGAMQATAALTVTDARLTQLEVTPGTTSTARGTSAEFQVTGLYSDGTTKDLTAQASWSAGTPSVAELEAATPGRVRGAQVGTSTITARIGTTSASATLTVTAAELTRLELNPSSPSVARGTTTALTATGIFTDGSTQDVTQQATWSAQAPTIATASNAPGSHGVVTGLVEGTTEVLAQLGALTGRVALTVTAAVLAEVQVTPTQPTIPAGTSVRLTATGVFSDGTTQDLTAQASWSSATPSSVNVSNGTTRGVATGLMRGQSQVSATVRGKAGSVLVTVTDAVLVSLSVSPTPLTLARGTDARLVAMAVYSDNSSQMVTTQVRWSSSDATIATVSNATGHFGEVRAVSPGAVEVRAQLGAAVGLARIAVTPAQLVSIEVTPATTTLAAGLTQAFTATGRWTDATTQDLTGQVTWASSNPAAATVSNAAANRGVATAIAAGTTSLTASLSGQTGSATITVTPASLLSLSITPPSLSVSRGTVANLSVRGTYTDGAAIELTTQVAWTSADAGVATISNAAGSEGQVRAVSVGSTTLTAQLSGITANATITVTPALLQAIELTPLSSTAPIGTTVVFTATGRYSDGTTQDLTAQATWISSDPVIASISNAPGAEGRAQALRQGSVTLSASAAGRTGTASLSVSAAALVSLAITPPTARLAPGTPMQLQATGTWTDGSTKDLTAQATWTTSDPAIAQISNVAPAHGRLSAIAPGSVEVRATVGVISGASAVTVSSASLTAIELTPQNPGAPAGLTQRMRATGLFSDGSQQDLSEFVSWSSADTGRASVSNAAGSQGLVSALSVGTSTITATALGVTGSATFTVSSALLASLSVTPATAAVPRGSSLAYTAMGTFTDGSTSELTQTVTWSTSDGAIASISNAAGTRGVATGVSTGTVTLTASLSGRSGTASLTVNSAALVSIAVTPVNPSMPLGVGAQLTATGTYTDGSTQDLSPTVTWSSSNGAVASVSNAAGSNGRVSSTGVGTARLSATAGGISGSTTVTVTAAQLVSLGVTPANPTIPLGLSQQLTATGVYTDGSTQDLTALASWSSSDAAIAPVSSSPQGRVTAAAQGRATITASWSGRGGSTVITVSPAVLQQLQLTPPAPSLPAGLTLQLTATGIYSDATTQDLTATATWSTSDAALAHVSNTAGSRGLVTGIAAGSATLTATERGVTGSVTVTVTPAVLQQVQVTPANASVPRGVPQRFTATGLYSNGSTQDLTTTASWTSSDGTRVSISNAAGSEGLASALNVGAVSISAAHLGISGSTPFTVTAAALTGLTLTPTNATVPLGSTRQMQVIGSYTDGSTQLLTSQASFASSNAATVSLSNAAGSRGLATTTATGTVTLTASAQGFTASTQMTVTQAALASIDLTPANGSTALGYSRQFIAIGTYTDGTTQVLTTQVTWASSDESKAFISNASSSRGLLSPVAPGAVTITASWNGVTGSTSHTISPAVLVDLSIVPDTFTVAVAGTRQLTALGTFSDGSTQDLTTTATWSSSAPDVVQVSNAAGSHGLATGIAAGVATVTASSGSRTGTSNATVP